VADLSTEWENAKPVSLQADWDSATPMEPTAMERGKAGLAGVNRGIAGLVGLPMDTAENLVNLGIAGVGTAATALGKPEWAPDILRGTPGGSESISRLMGKAGIGTVNPRPDDPVSRMLYTGGTIAGGSMIPGASVKGALTAATGGAIAGEVGGPEWVGVGAIAPFAAGQAAAGLKNAVAARAAPIVKTFEQAGTTPSVGQATDNTFLHGLENLASKFPGGAGVMERFITSQQATMGAKARTGVPTEAAGRAIEKGVAGEGGFLARTKATWQQLDNAVAAKIPANAAMRPSNTLQALEGLTKPTIGAEKTSQVMSTPKVAEIRSAMRADLAGTPPERTITLLGADGKTPIASIPIGGTPGKETMPYQAIRELRSKVGSMLDNALVSGIPGGELKKLYGALSKDLEVAAQQAGAGREFTRQNNYYRSRMDRIETVLDRVIGKGKQPEDIFKSFMPTDPDQANKARAVMRSLTPSERQVVSEAAANRLGRAKPGVQGAENEIFSSETFLTNWNKLSPGAKAQLFPEPPLRDNMNKIANAAAAIREGKGIYANPSGTAGSFAAYSVYLSPLASVAAGSFAPVIVAGMAAGTAFIGAKMLTNPRIVEWLATPVNPSTSQAAAHLARLAVIYNSTKDQALKEELAAFIQSTTANTASTPATSQTLRGINSALPTGPAPAPVRRTLPSFVRG